MKRLLRKVAASVADQGVASSTNFLLNVLLARWLVPSEYGAYSVCWSTLLVLAGFHNALILEPMSIVGPADYKSRLDAYLQSNVRLNWIVSLALALAVLLAAVIYKQPAVRSSLFLMAASVPGYLLILLVRRKQYVLNQPLRALGVSLSYAAVMLTLVYLCRAAGKLSALTAIACFGVAGLVGYAAVLRKNGEATPVGEVARAHWRYGKWLVASAIMAIGAPDVQTILLSTLVDLKSAGALRALMNFVTPLFQLVSVLSTYALPRLAGRAAEWGAPTLLRRAVYLPAALFAITAVYLGVLILFAPRLEHLLYGGKMQAYLQWIPLLAASAFVACIGGAFSTLLRAVQNSQHQFISGVTGSVVGIGCAFFLLRRIGFAGALWSMLAANVTNTLIIIGTYVWKLRQRDA